MVHDESYDSDPFCGEIDVLVVPVFDNAFCEILGMLNWHFTGTV